MLNLGVTLPLHADKDGVRKVPAPSVNVTESSKPVFDLSLFENQPEPLFAGDEIYGRLREAQKKYQAEKYARQRKVHEKIKNRGLDGEEAGRLLAELHRDELKRQQRFEMKQQEKIVNYQTELREDKDQPWWKKLF